MVVALDKKIALEADELEGYRESTMAYLVRCVGCEWRVLRRLIHSLVLQSFHRRTNLHVCLSNNIAVGALSMILSSCENHGEPWPRAGLTVLIDGSQAYSCEPISCNSPAFFTFQVVFQRMLEPIYAASIRRIRPTFFISPEPVDGVGF
jgi:hypothetical protein